MKFCLRQKDRKTERLRCERQKDYVEKQSFPGSKDYTNPLFLNVKSISFRVWSRWEKSNKVKISSHDNTCNNTKKIRNNTCNNPKILAFMTPVIIVLQSGSGEQWVISVIKRVLQWVHVHVILKVDLLVLPRVKSSSLFSAYIGWV